MRKYFRFLRNETKLYIYLQTKSKMYFEMAELLTEKQKARRQRDTDVVAAYRDMCRKYPGASRTRIIDELAKRNVGGLKSYYGIRKALVNRGII